MKAARDRSVFVNCPFDPEYKPLFDAIVFTVAYCGYDVRSALEEEDSANVRLEKIIGLLKESRLSVHDISRVEQDTPGPAAIHKPTRSSNDRHPVWPRSRSRRWRS